MANPKGANKYRNAGLSSQLSLRLPESLRLRVFGLAALRGLDPSEAIRRVLDETLPKWDEIVREATLRGITLEA